MNDSYLTIQKPATATVTEKRSRFLAFAFPVDSQARIKQLLDNLSKEYFDARHICYAYMLGAERTVFRANDNGEPSGTAGRPILGQINSFGLTDILIVVVRYFGGIKLGTPGLIAAYKAAAKEVIENAEIITLHQTAILSFSFSYMVLNDVMKLSRMPGIEIIENRFDNSCVCTWRVTLDTLPPLRDKLERIDSLYFIENTIPENLSCDPEII